MLLFFDISQICVNGVLVGENYKKRVILFYEYFVFEPNCDGWMSSLSIS